MGPQQATELQSPRCLGSMARSSPLQAPLLMEDDVDELRIRGLLAKQQQRRREGRLAVLASPKRLTCGRRSCP